jgi:hypothetical protein
MSRETEPKKVYVPPKLVEYGSVAKLTQGGSESALSDSGANMMMPP